MSEVNEARVSGSIRHAVDYLSNTQTAGGEFRTSWSRLVDMSDSTYVESPFITGLIFLALSTFRDARMAVLRRRGIAYLLTKRRANSFFSFLNEGIDCDLDNICLLNWVIQSVDHRREHYRALAEKIARFPRREGLYETWMRAGANHENDTDPCVSVNTLRFLCHNGIKCDETIAALREMLRGGAYLRGTLYYESGYALPYLIFTLTPELRGALLKVPEKGATCARRPPWLSRAGKLSIIDKAFRLFILSSCDDEVAECDELAGELLADEMAGGGWPNWGAFRAFNYWGSAQLTTAFVAQALDRYRATRFRTLSSFGEVNHPASN